MKAICNILFSALILCTGHIFAQQLTIHSEITLPDSIAQAKTEWADLDNDGLNDILLLVTTDTHKHYAMYIKGDTLNTPRLPDTAQVLVTPDAYKLIDFNLDNQLDIVISGSDGTTSRTIVYQNKGNFEFDEITLPIPAFETLRVADLDNDGIAEWVVSGLNDNGPYLNILRPDTTGPWTIVTDTFKIQTTALEVTDADNNGILDLFVSGTVSADSLFTGFLINNGDFSFTPTGSQPWAGTAALSDFNADGNADIIFTGHDANGNNVSKRFNSATQGHIIANNPFTLQNGYTFAADLDSDGIPDFNYLGSTPTNDTLNIIAYAPNNYDTLPHHNVSSQRFGDLEHDGDLDLIQIIAKTPIVVRILANQPMQKNKAPEKPFNAIGLPVFNRQFLYWQKPFDDSTPTASITYDLFIYANASPLQAGEFDLLLDRRMTVTPGNNGTANFRLLKNITAPTIQFSVQAVDNALHAGATCTGSGGSASCATISAKPVSACSGETVSLSSPAPALWFSFSRGYLGTSQALSLQPTRPDTVFSFLPQQPGCSALKAFVISINNDTIKHITETVYSCKDATITLGTTPGWQNIQWTSLLTGNLGTDDTIHYHVVRPDTVSVTASNGMGCTILRKTGIALSAPVVSVEADAYRIMKGQSVQLQATGAQAYQWSPPEGLDRADTATPAASPLTTTTYTVTGYDTLGCTAKATATVWVESTAFVPTLFSPNDDGSNDRLKAYGLAPAGRFMFRVFNRQGGLVFKTNSIDEIVQTGWDGTTNGVRQPGGVYYWEVDGTSTTGNTLLLNGKKSGFVVLIR